MLRVLVALVVLAGVARADTVQTFAIDLRSKDAMADKITLALEEGLRTLGSAKTADYRAKGTRKDRVAASTDDCPSALTIKCAAEIGTRLGVDLVFAGTVETRGARFILLLSVVHVRTGQRLRSFRDLGPTSVDGKKWARTVLNRIADTTVGTLKIICNAQRASILLDGHPATELFNGRGAVIGLALGTHAIEVRAQGFKTYVGEVNVVGETPLNVLLDRVADP